MNAEQFNALYEVGTPVFAYPGARPEDFPNDTRLVTRTRSKASVLGGHTDVVWVDGHSACITLSHVDVVTEDEWRAARAAEDSAAARVRHLRGQMRPAPPADDVLAAYESVDFTDLMDEEAAVVVGRMRDQLLGEIQRLAFLERNTLPELHRDAEHHKAGKQRWRERAEKAEARVRELERPAVEAKRNEIRDSYTELIAAAEETKDFEGAFDVHCRLREREEQWKREDGEVAR